MMDESSEKTIPDHGVSQQISSNPRFPHLHGWRLLLSTVAIMISTFLVNIEVSIVSTSLVAITSDLNGFDKTSWIVTAYLITYTGFMIVLSKLSDIFGRKSTLICSMSLFVIFSAGCGASQTVDELIINRAFQGVGSAGSYSISVVILFEMVPRAKYVKYSATAVTVVACANVLGPIIGGLMTTSGTWRWTFLFNIPIGILAIALLALALPKGFPKHSQEDQKEQIGMRLLQLKKFRRVDFVGAMLLLTASLLLVTALLEVSVQYSWSSGATIALLVISGACWLSFLSWEYLVTMRKQVTEPVFPWTFFKNRIFMGMLATSFLVGVPFNVLIIDLPQRFQALDGTSPLEAGIKLIPYTFISPVCSVISNVVASKTKIAFVYLLLFGACLQLLGIALLATLAVGSMPYPVVGYIAEGIAGAGVGISFSILVLETPFAVRESDLGVATAAIIQLRFLGGAIGLAITSSYMNSYLSSQLSSVLGAKSTQALLDNVDTISSLTSEQQSVVRGVFASSYGAQVKVLIGFAVAQILTIMLTWNKPVKGQVRCP